jgi:diaminopimelate decarboxylase
MTTLHHTILKNISHNCLTPVYAYDYNSIKKNVENILCTIKYKYSSIHFAAMANNNIAIQKVMQGLNIKSFITSLEELYIVQTAGYKSEEILFCGNNLSPSEITEVAKSGAMLIAESEEQMLRFKKYGKVNKMGIRISLDPSFYREIKETEIQRLGIPINILNNALLLAEKNDIEIVGLHTYIGTNIKDFGPFSAAISLLIEQAKRINALEYIDLSGGFGISYEDDTFPFNCTSLGEVITEKMRSLSDYFNREIELKIEPGRALIANTAVLLATVTEVKRYNGNVFIGIDTNLSNFSRPYIYREYHKIFPVNQEFGREIENNVFICGNSAKSDDFFAYNITFPKVSEGDVLFITNVGAYGYSMSSNFCSKLKPMEILIDKNEKIQVIRERESKEDLLINQKY